MNEKLAHCSNSKYLNDTVAFVQKSSEHNFRHTLVISSAEAAVKQSPVKQSPLNQPSTGMTTGSVHKASTTVSSKPQTAERARGDDPELCENGVHYQKQVLKVSPQLKQEN